ncbi:hypothetical protein [Nocardia sp. NBC_01327]|uniref:hypothetical protein n=1 Tax=Nocardia sp. NBC_01327 TaxID=2903593 RepID=UPI002E12EDA1|nr:hypothetical protein OG326_18770 [Nocardia sp. NBC_01327]
MNLRTTAFAAAVAAGAITVAATPASAEPDTTLGYHATIRDNAVVTTLDEATFALAPDAQSVLVRDAGGEQRVSVPMTYQLDGALHSIQQQITDDGHTLTLRPGTDLQPVASPMENQLAMNEFSSRMLTGPAVGTVVGLLLGAVVGGVVGLGSCLVVGPACLATVPAAIGAFAAAGGVLGTLALGGAAAADGLWKYVTTLQAAPGQSAYAPKVTLDADGTGVPDANLRLPSGSANGFKTGSSGGSSHG